MESFVYYAPTEVIFGNKSVARAVTENVGAVREFQGIVRAWEED